MQDDLTPQNAQQETEQMRQYVALLQEAIDEFVAEGRLISEEIREVEHRTRISDPKRSNYSLLALSMRKRRKNLAISVELLNEEIDKVSAAIAASKDETMEGGEVVQEAA